MKMTTRNMIGSMLAMGLVMGGMANRAESQTVTAISDPFSAFGIGEVQNVKFIGVNTPADGFNVDMFDLSLFLDGTTALARFGQPVVGQVGYSGPLTGTVSTSSMNILLWDNGALSFDNGTQLGTNAILLQSSAASGDVFDMALVFDIENITSFPVDTSVTNLYLVCDPVSGSFTMDSAIAAAQGGPTDLHVPEPSSTVLLGVGMLGCLMRRKR